MYSGCPSMVFDPVSLTPYGENAGPKIHMDGKEYAYPLINLSQISVTV